MLLIISDSQIREEVPILSSTDINVSRKSPYGDEKNIGKGTIPTQQLIVSSRLPPHSCEIPCYHLLSQLMINECALPAHLPYQNKQSLNTIQVSFQFDISVAASESVCFFIPRPNIKNAISRVGFRKSFS